MPEAADEPGVVDFLIVNRCCVSRLSGKEICRVYRSCGGAIGFVEDFRQSKFFQSHQGSARDDAAHRTAFDDERHLYRRAGQNIYGLEL